ncbi:hypothetical protein J7443_10060 [Tropicibacter sp. R15_0]|uniref:hypothetical protein n=1 Tax=Tropicibacter sp. R15_0 TaxID=2821101 RepID=UPI001ADB656B|nr:hypothetical protein [Tropicibacter sp. R15_0]MBO9465571.1 hypothetical protein [Tropicibacter sp. R15_0]
MKPITQKYTTLFASLLLSSSILFLNPQTAQADSLDVMIYERGGDGQVAECTLDMVEGLNTERDGFLSVRSGPGASFRQIDQLHNGDFVITFDIRGDWAGVYYGRGHELIENGNEIGCGYVGEGQRPVPYPGKKGWVHRNWLVLVAG